MAELRIEVADPVVECGNIVVQFAPVWTRHRGCILTKPIGYAAVANCPVTIWSAGRSIVLDHRLEGHDERVGIESLAEHGLKLFSGATRWDVVQGEIMSEIGPLSRV